MLLQVLYLEASKKGRFLTLDKRRFETETTRYELDSRYATFEAENELGITVQVECVYGWPKPADGELPDQCKDFKDSELLSKVVEVVKAGFGLNQSEVCKAVGGNKSTVVAAIARGVEAGSIRIEAGPNGSRLHFYNELSSKF